MDNRKYGREMGEACEATGRRCPPATGIPKFREVLRQRLEASCPSITSHFDVGAMADYSGADPSDACYILLSGEAGVYVGQERIAVWAGGSDRRIGAPKREAAQCDRDDDRKGRGFAYRAR